MIRPLVLILLPMLAYGQYGVTTVAGGAPATVGLGGGITGDSAGNIYLCGSTIVSRLSPDGKVATVAGTGVPGYSGDGGPAVSAQLNGVDSCVMDKSGNLIIADVNNFRIRKIDTNGIINTIVGVGTVGGFVNDAGNGGPGTQAQISYVSALTTDVSGNLYFHSKTYDRWDCRAVRRWRLGHGGWRICAGRADSASISGDGNARNVVGK